MSQQPRLKREDLKRLKDMCKGRDYEAIVALLEVHIQEATQNCRLTTNDHRYHQGKYAALVDFLTDIIKKPT